MSIKTHTKWLITYLVYNNTYYELKTKLEYNGELPEGYFSMQEQTNYLFNKIKYLPYNEDITIIIIHLDYDFINHNFSLTAIKKEKSDLVILPAFFDLNEPMTSSKSLKNIFNILNDYFTFDQIIIITYGHGCLFGINLTDKKLYDELLKNATFLKTDFAKRVNKFQLREKELFETNKIYETTISKTVTAFNIFKSILFNKFKISLRHFLKENTLEEDFEEMLKITMLTNLELREGIQASFKKRKIDILVMYNCSMQNVYTQYEFKDCVDYFVAPSGAISFPGYDYKGVYDKIAANVNSPVKAIADEFVLNIGKCDDHIFFENEIKNTWFISSTKLDEIILDKIKQLYDRWIILLINSLKDNKSDMNLISALITNRITTQFNMNTESVSDLMVVDFFVFLKELELSLSKSKLYNNTNQISLQKLTSDLIQQYNSLTQTTYYDNNFYGDLNSEYYADCYYKQNKGISIIFSISSNLKYEIIKRIFDKHEKDKKLIPKFLINSKTGELLDTYIFPH